MAETACLGFTLRDGNGDGVAADGRQTVGAEIVHDVEIDRLSSGAGTPTGAGIVAAGKSIPEVAADGVPFAVAAAVAAPRGVGESGLSVDKNCVGLGVEFVTASPAAMAC